MMKTINRGKKVTDTSYKTAYKKRVINEKSIPKGHQCYKLRPDSLRNVYYEEVGTEWQEMSLKICPFLETYFSNYEGDVTEFCSLLQIDIENGYKECKFNHGETPYIDLLEYVISNQDIDEDTDFL